MRKLMFVFTLAFLLAGTTKALAQGPCPAAGYSPGCNMLITINPNGSVTVVNTGNTPYDGSDDNMYGVINNSSHLITSMYITGSGNGGGAFEFDFDGACAYGIDKYLMGETALKKLL